MVRHHAKGGGGILGEDWSCGEGEEAIPPNLFLDFIEGMQFSPVDLLF